MADRRGVMMSLRHDLQRIQHFWCDRSSHLQIEVTLEFLQCGPGFLADNAIDYALIIAVGLEPKLHPLGDRSEEFRPNQTYGCCETNGCGGICGWPR